MDDVFNWEEEALKMVEESPTQETACPGMAARSPWGSSAPGSGYGPNAALWLGPGGSYAPYSSMARPQAYPAPWTYTWAHSGGEPGTGHLQAVPSIWSWDGPSSGPGLGGPCPSWCGATQRRPVGASVSPASSAWPSLAGSPPQTGRQTPPKVGFMPAPGLQGCRAPLPEWTAQVSIWSLWPPSSPELCPLPPTPDGDPEPRPRSPQPTPGPPCKARRSLFSSSPLSSPSSDPTPTPSPSKDGGKSPTPIS